MITGLNHVETFLAKMAPTAQAIGRKWNIPPSVIIAQAALESGWGQAVKGNAYFGIKQGASDGESLAFTTHEVINGQVVALVDRFRTYRSLQDATKAYAQFLHDTPRYQNALQDTSDPAKFATALQQAGYATDPRYAEKLQQIIQRYELTSYDSVGQTAPLHKAPEQGGRSGLQRGSRWSEGASTAPRYLTIAQSYDILRPLSRKAYQTDTPDQMPPTPPPRAAAEGQPELVGSRALDPGRQPTQVTHLENAKLPRRGPLMAEFPRMLWEQIRQYTWINGWQRRQPSRPTPEAPLSL
jgi:hypothetical protein